MKESEARIMVVLGNLDPKDRYPSYISGKLGIDYAYTLHMLKGMVIKGWLNTWKSNNKSYYSIGKKELIKEAKKVLTGQEVLKCH